MSEDNFQSQLEHRIQDEFKCASREARRVAEQATKMRNSIRRDPGGAEDFEVTIDLVISKLYEAPDQHSIPGKWNWWAGSIAFVDERSRNFKID